METMRDIRMRLKSIQNTKQITESMRLISTQKVQKVRRRLADNQPYFRQSGAIMESIVHEPKFHGHSYIVGKGKEKQLVILITGDRGFCGGYNTNVSKNAYVLLQKCGDSQVIAIGTKGRDYLRRRQMPIAHSFKGLSENPFHEDARYIGDIAMKLYDEGAADEVHLVYTEYETMLIQTPKIVRLLPVEKGGADGYSGGYSECRENGIDWMSDQGAYMRYAVSAYVASLLFGAMLESAVCEQCARVMSMDSAVKNADKMMESLTIRYNQMRQGDITQEIAEVVGGANVVSQK